MNSIDAQTLLLAACVLLLLLLLLLLPMLLSHFVRRIREIAFR